MQNRSGLQIRAYEAHDLEPLVALLSAVFPDPAPHNEPRASIRRKLGYRVEERVSLGKLLGPSEPAG